MRKIFSTIIAGLAAVCGLTAFGDYTTSRVISVNFGSNYAAAVDGNGILSVPAGQDGGWVDASGTSGSAEKSVIWGGNGEALTIENSWKVEWKVTGDTWKSGGDGIMYGYLDDQYTAANAPEATFTGIPFETYDAYVYLASDKNTLPFSPITVTEGADGTAVSYSAAANGTGIAGATAIWGMWQSTPVAGKNVIIIKGLTNSQLKIKTGVRVTNVQRAGLAAVQIVESEAVQTTHTANIAGEVNFSALKWDVAIPEDYSSETLVVNTTDDATLIFDKTLTSNPAAIKFTGNKKLTIKVADDATLPTTVWATMGFTGTLAMYNCDLGVTAVGNGGTLSYAGTTALTSFPMLDSSFTGYTIDVAAPYTTDGQLKPVGNKTYTFSTGAAVTADYITLGNNGSVTQTYTQKAGTVKATSSNAATSTSAALLLGHWNSTVTYKVFGGTLEVPNAPIRLGWDGTGNLIVNGGTVKTTGFRGGNQDSHGGAGTLTLRAGKIEMGSYGVVFGSAGTIDLDGGTLKATDSSTVTAGKAFTLDGTVTIDVVSDKTLTFNSAFSGAGTLKKTGAGTLKITAVGSGFTGTFDVQEGTIDFGAKRDFSDLTATFAEGAMLAVTETTAEYRAGSLTVTGLNEGTKVAVSRADGTTTLLTADSEGKASMTGDIHVSGKGCWMDYTFTLDTRASRLDNPGANGRQLYSAGANTGSIETDNGYTVTNSLSETTGFLYMKATPYTTVTYPSTFSAATYATMPAREHDTLMAFGTKNGGCIALVRGATENDIVVLWAKNGSDAVSLATLKVKNALQNKHLVAFSMTSDYIYVYLDGKQKSKVEMSADYTMGTGFQVGSVHGGVISGVCNQAAATDTAEIKMIRLYETALTSAEMAALVTEFPAENNGSSSRTFNAAAEDWVKTDAWQIPETESTTVAADAPKAGTDVLITADYENEDTGATETVVTLNLSDPESIGDLEITGDGSIKILKGTDSAALEVTGDLTVGAPLTVAYGDLDLTSVSIENNASITMDITAAASAFTTPYKTTTINLLGPTTGDGTVTFTGTVTVEGPGTVGTPVQDATTGAWTLTYTTDHDQGADIYYVSGYLGADSGVDKLVVKNAKGDECSIFPGDIVTFDSTYTTVTTVWVPTTLPANIGGFKVNSDISLTSGDGTILAGKTVTVASTATLTIAWNKNHTTTLGKVVFNGGNVTLADGVKIGGAVSGSSTVTVASGSTVEITSDGSLANTLSGAGTIKLADGVMPNLTTSSDWTGTIEVGTVSGNLVKSATIYGTLSIGEGKTLTINNGFGNTTNVIAAITGAGDFTITKSTGLAGSNQIEIGNVDGFTGRITTTSIFPIVLPEGYILDGNGYVILEANAIAQVGTAKYKDLASAITAVAENGTVTVLKAGTETVTIDKNMTLSENGDFLKNDTITVAADKTLTLTEPGDNCLFTIKGEDQTTSKVILASGFGHGFTQGSTFRTLTLEVASGATPWIEKRSATDDELDATVDLVVNGQITVGNGGFAYYGTLVCNTIAGEGTIETYWDTCTLYITSPSTFAGTLNPPVVLGEGATLTVSKTPGGTVTAADTDTYGVLTKAVEGGTKYYLGYKVTFEKGEHVAAFTAGETTFGADYTFEKDTDLTFTVTFDKDYEVEAVTVNGGEITPNEGTTATYTVTCDGAKAIKATAKATATATPIDPTKSTDPYESADAAQKAIDDGKVVVGASTEVATALTDDQLTTYKGLFTLVVTSDNKIAQVLNETGTNTVQGTVTAAVSPVLTAALTKAEDAKATVTTTPGIYYAIEYGTAVSLGKNTAGELAKDTETNLTMPTVEGDKAFFRVKASVTPIAAKTEE